MLVDTIKKYIEDHELIAPQDLLIVGLSGGPDSVFLLHLLHQLQLDKQLTLIAAHLDHGWRPNSWEDAQWCQQLCQHLGVPFIAKQAQDYEHKVTNKGSKEAFGRALRRLFFQDIATQYHAQSVALAHHADDQQETFFIRLVRGATLSGLCGIQPKRGIFIRPLLTVYKKDILAYLNTHNIAYLIDPSNESPSFLRNRIRHSVLPNLRASDERFDHNFERTLYSLQKAESFLEMLTSAALHASSLTDGNLSLSSFKSLHPFLQHRVILQWLIDHNLAFPLSEAFLDEIIRFIHSRTFQGRHTLTSHLALEKFKDTLRIVKLT